MKSLVSIRIDDETIKAMRDNARTLQLSKTDYIRQAIERMNRETEHHASQKRLKDASLRVRKESMSVNLEFSEIEHDPSA